MARDWTLTLRGGPWDGERVTWPVAEPVLIAWTCGGRTCDGHFTMDPDAYGIVLERAVAYRRVERDEEARTALYEVGPDDRDPEREAEEERELVAAGVHESGDGPGLPYVHVPDDAEYPALD